LPQVGAPVPLFATTMGKGPAFRSNEICMLRRLPQVDALVSLFAASMGKRREFRLF